MSICFVGMWNMKFFHPLSFFECCFCIASRFKSHLAKWYKPFQRLKLSSKIDRLARFRLHLSHLMEAFDSYNSVDLFEMWLLGELPWLFWRKFFWSMVQGVVWQAVWCLACRTALLKSQKLNAHQNYWYEGGIQAIGLLSARKNIRYRV